VIASGKHLLSLINDVLDISKIESGALELFIEERVNVDQILKDVAATGEGLIGGKPVQLALNIEDTLPPIVADERRIRQIILNIVSNACKFTDAGSITINARCQENKELLISIKDTGPGIATDEHTMVFDSFKQTKTGLSHGGGTGLGMPISKRLAEAHGGRLWLESVLGQGSTFFVALPIQSEALLKLYQERNPS
jgi:signal transduction histidine kinase